MRIDELTQDQLTLMIQIVLTSPLLSVATIPRMHKDFPTKGEYFAEIRRDAEHLESLGFIIDITEQDGDHKRLNESIEKVTGYKYRVYSITEVGILMFQGLAEEMKKEMDYRNTIN